MELALWRKRSLMLTLGGAAVLVANHLTIVYWEEGYVFAVAVAPVMVALGLAGLVEPRVLGSAANDGPDLPVGFKVAAVLALLVGAAVAFFLVTVVYEFE